MDHGPTDSRTYNRYVSWMARHLAARMGGGLTFQDLAQEGWIGYLQARDRVDGTAPPVQQRTYVRRKIWGAMHDAARHFLHTRRAGTPPVVVPLVDDVASTLSDGGVPSPEWQAMQAEAWRQILPSLVALSAKRQFVLYAYYWRGRTFREIGEEVGRGESNIVLMHTLTLRTLKRQLMHSLESAPVA